MKKINANVPLFTLIKMHPEIKAILYEIGFKRIMKPGMLESVGRFMTLNKGKRMQKIDNHIIITLFKKYDYKVEALDERVN